MNEDGKVDDYPCNTCIYAWTDECPREKCWKDDYRYYVKESEDGNVD